MNDLFLGIDTSNYTTSVALVSEKGEVIANLKRPLPVKEGERGVRQSEAVFHHTVNLPCLFDELAEYLPSGRIAAVGVSEKPRNAEGSYMPCFLAGVSAAKGIATALGVKLHGFSHQCGHIAAAAYSAGCADMLLRDFAAFHISGGTTELVKVSPLRSGFDTQVVGGTKDLNAGQAIDRIGVLMGLPFPSGKHIEALALQNTAKIPKRKISADKTYVNLSGLENIAIKLYSETNNRELTAAFVLDYIGRAIIEMCRSYENDFGSTEFLLAGGVMSNSIIKNMLRQSGLAVHFGEPDMSADNAVGTAFLASRSHRTEKL